MPARGAMHLSACQDPSSLPGGAHREARPLLPTRAGPSATLATPPFPAPRACRPRGRPCVRGAWGQSVARGRGPLPDVPCPGQGIRVAGESCGRLPAASQRQLLSGGRLPGQATASRGPGVSPVGFCLVPVPPSTTGSATDCSQPTPCLPCPLGSRWPPIPRPAGRLQLRAEGVAGAACRSA